MQPNEIRFPASGVTCAAWHWPAQDPAPCVVLGHGFGATRAGGLARYAQRFAAAGFAVLAFDYRHFGDSDGEPRQLLDVPSQLADWASAVVAARALPDVDPERIALWGSSFAGGHVLEVAVRDPRVAAVISQVPHTSGPSSALVSGPLTGLKLLSRGLADLRAARRGRRPVTVPIVGPPGSVAAMTTPDAEAGYAALFGDAPWRNEAAARVIVALGSYSPGRAAGRVHCPLLVQVGDHDAVTPPGPSRKAAARAPQGELLGYPYGHFEVYSGAPFERLVADQLAFLQRTLQPSLQDAA